MPINRNLFANVQNISQTVGPAVSFPPPTTSPPQVDVTKTIESSPSVAAYHSTIFRSFYLTATATYNFYVEGENVAPTFDTSGSLNSIPRYVTLRWHTAPLTIEPTKKGIRQSDAPRVPAVTALKTATAAFANGYVSPGVVSAIISDPPVKIGTAVTKIDEDSFLLSRAGAGRSAANIIGDKTSEFAIQPKVASQSNSVVNFIDPSIAGAFATSRINVANDLMNLTVAGSLTKIIGALEVISEFNQDIEVNNPPPDFVSRSDAPALSYVGYVIDRYDMKKDGSLSLGRTIMVEDPSISEFVDRQVAYDETYSYRIRSIVQWSRTSDIDFSGFSTIDRVTSFSSLVLPPLASFYAGDWSGWSTVLVEDTVPPEPPDEVTVRPVSWRGEIVISWKIGHDPQHDLVNFKLLRASSLSGRVSDWKELGTFIIGNGLYIDRDVRPYIEGGQSYIYGLYATSYHGVDSLLSDQVEAKLSSLRSREELPVVQVAIKGIDRTEHASGKHLPDATEIKANKSLKFYCRNATSGHPLRDSTYIAEIRSLSTGERALVNLDVDATDIGVTDA